MAKRKKRTMNAPTPLPALKENEVSVRDKATPRDTLNGTVYFARPSTVSVSLAGGSKKTGRGGK